MYKRQVLATAHTGFADSLPASLPTRATAAADPGVAARMSSLTDGLGSLVADLDPELLLGSDAASLYAAFCRLERLIVAGKTLLAPRIAASGHWEAEGHRSPATLLAVSYTHLDVYKRQCQRGRPAPSA